MKITNKKPAPAYCRLNEVSRKTGLCYVPVDGEQTLWIMLGVNSMLQITSNGMSWVDIGNSSVRVVKPVTIEEIIIQELL